MSRVKRIRRRKAKRISPSWRQTQLDAQRDVLHAEMLTILKQSLSGIAYVLATFVLFTLMAGVVFGLFIL